MKDPTFYSSLVSGPGSIISANRVRHGFLRKQASHGFSEAALRSQETVIKEHADLFVSRLKESVEKQEATVDIVGWFNVSEHDMDCTSILIGIVLYIRCYGCLDLWRVFRLSYELGLPSMGQRNLRCDQDASVDSLLKILALDCSLFEEVHPAGGYKETCCQPTRAYHQEGCVPQVYH